MVLNGNNIIIDVESLMPLNLLSVLWVNNYKASSLKYVNDQISNSLFLFVRMGHIPIYYHIHKAFVTMKIQILENIIESSIIAVVGRVMLNIIILQCHSNIINS